VAGRGSVPGSRMVQGLCGFLFDVFRFVFLDVLLHGFFVNFFR